MKRNILTIAVASAIVFVALPWVSTPTAFAQQPQGSYNESVVVKGQFTPTIEEHTKLNFPAAITDTLTRMEHTFQYDIHPTRIRALYDPSRIKAARIIGEPVTRLYNNYFRIGMGNYLTPLADLYWSSTRDRLKTYGVRLNHRSSWWTLPDHGANHFGLTDVTLFGKYIVKDILQLSADLGYEHDHNLYYGFTDSLLALRMGGLTRDDISLSDYRSKWNLASLNLGVRNMQLDANRFGYSANLRLNDLWASWYQNEFNLNLSGDMHYGFNIKDKYKGVAYLRAEWDGYYHTFSPDADDVSLPLGYTALPPDSSHGARNIVKINPYADFMLNGLQIHAGFTAGWDGFTANGDTVIFRLFPDLVVSKSLLHDAVVVSLGATGGIDANSWNTLRLINPYIAPDAEQRATRHYDAVAHLRWNLSKKLELNLEASYALLRDDVTFSLHPLYALDNVYTPHYFDNNRITLGGDITFVNDEMITLRAGGHYYHYDLIGGETQLLYRPDWDALLSAKLNYHNKFLFFLEGRLLGAMQGDLDDALPMRYGVAAEFEYRHNRALSFFLRADNLAFQRYLYWANYPSQRGLFILGLTYTIPTQK